MSVQRVEKKFSKRAYGVLLYTFKSWDVQEQQKQNKTRKLEEVAPNITYLMERVVNTRKR